MSENYPSRRTNISNLYGIHGWNFLHIQLKLQERMQLGAEVPKAFAKYQRRELIPSNISTLLWMLISSTCLIACPSPDNSLVCPNPSDAILKDGGPSADAQTAKGWVENDDGKGGKLVNVEWRWENPLPQGNRLNDVWGFNEKDIYAVGDHGTILHYNGVDWTLMESGTDQDLLALCGCSASEIIVSGTEGALLVLKNNIWKKFVPAFPTRLSIYDVWCNTLNRVTTVGANRSYFYYNGEQWLEKQWISDKWPDPYDINHHLPLDFLSIWSDETGYIFGAGSMEVFFQVDPQQTQSVLLNSSIDSNIVINDFWGTNSNNLFLVFTNTDFPASSIYNYDGKTLNLQENFNELRLRSLSGISEKNIIAVGDNGAIRHFNGAGWNKEQTLSKNNFRKVFGIGPSTFYIVGEQGIIYANDGDAWKEISSGYRNHINAVGFFKNILYAVGSNGIILQQEKHKWKSIANNPATNELNAIFSDNKTAFFVVGKHCTLVKFDGFSWRKIPLSCRVDLNGIWGVNEKQIWVVGSEGTLLKFDGIKWHNTHLDTDETLTSILGNSTNDIVVLGEQHLFHYNGKNWDKMAIESLGKWKVISIDSKGGYLLINGASLYNFDGKSISFSHINAPCEIVSVVRENTGFEMLALSCGKLLIKNGESWILIDVPIKGGVRTLFQNKSNEFILAGNSGLILSLTLLQTK